MYIDTPSAFGICISTGVLLLGAGIASGIILFAFWRTLGVLVLILYLTYYIIYLLLYFLLCFCFSVSATLFWTTSMVRNSHESFHSSDFLMLIICQGMTVNLSRSCESTLISTGKAITGAERAVRRRPSLELRGYFGSESVTYGKWLPKVIEPYISQTPALLPWVFGTARLQSITITSGPTICADQGFAIVRGISIFSWNITTERETLGMS